MSHSPNPLDHFAIQNTIARYCIALDTKDFALLSEVFTDDVEAKYPFPGGELKGVAAVQDAIRARLGPVPTQHALTTQMIAIHEDGSAASATTYFTGAHFGHGEMAGQVLTAYGKYVDELVCTAADKGRSDGTSGHWRVKRREVIFTARIGDEKIMTHGR